MKIVFFFIKCVLDIGVNESWQRELTVGMSIVVSTGDGNFQGVENDQLFLNLRLIK